MRIGGRGLVPLTARILGSRQSRGCPEELGMDDWPQQSPGDDTDRQQVGSCSSKPARQCQRYAEAPQRREHGYEASPAVALAMVAGFVATDQPAYLVGRKVDDAARARGREIPARLTMALQQ